jgi:ribosomal protein S1
MEFSDWGRLLAERFPKSKNDETEQKWAALQQRIAIGQLVTGVVVAKAPFGAWVDLGVGFPGLLEIICIAGLTRESYRANDWCPIGSEITAYVGGFRDRDHQVYLWQVRSDRDAQGKHPDE